MSYDTEGGWHDADPYADDREFDDMMARIDEGEECPKCHDHKTIARVTVLGIPMFQCACGADWFDVTADVPQ